MIFLVGLCGGIVPPVADFGAKGGGHKKLERGEIAVLLEYADHICETIIWLPEELFDQIRTRAADGFGNWRRKTLERGLKYRHRIDNAGKV